ncbi:C40 family peptidase [Sinomicrobium soli]|uniref:C40 family peptidase n=1 Tax=Sinomicrobium sp. N-1-3-6 TaxID=2219864 RepID=UPI000DCCC48E|nr:C40 family peptidase [Sinomicrobium sp. N-1-3-6]RAV29938.1 NlpC/P60 family protein [Sinomicrobium sp. N-1-3-6]
MIRNLFICCLLLCFCACKSGKKTVEKPRTISVKGTGTDHRTVTVEAWPAERMEKEKSSGKSMADPIIKTALSYNGTRYKYGGTTRKGMDCSGLVYVSFLEHDIALQRASYQMATQGKKIKLKEVRKGDLLFFKTGRKNRINHVGLVVDIKDEAIRFIHSTTSRGVLVSSLKEGYWNHAFTEARRIL